MFTTEQRSGRWVRLAGAMSLFLLGVGVTLVVGLLLDESEDPGPAASAAKTADIPETNRRTARCIELVADGLDAWVQSAQGNPAPAEQWILIVGLESPEYGIVNEISGSYIPDIARLGIQDAIRRSAPRIRSACERQYGTLLYATDLEAFCEVAATELFVMGGLPEPQLQQLEASAPDEVSAAVEVFASYVRALRSGDSADKDDYIAAGEEIKSYAANACS